MTATGPAPASASSEQSTSDGGMRVVYENQASISARSGCGSLLHLWKAAPPPSLADSMCCGTAAAPAAPACRGPRRLFGTSYEGLRPKQLAPSRRSARQA